MCPIRLNIRIPNSGVAIQLRLVWQFGDHWFIPIWVWYDGKESERGNKVDLVADYRKCGTQGGEGCGSRLEGNHRARRVTYNFRSPAGSLLWFWIIDGRGSPSAGRPPSECIWMQFLWPDRMQLAPALRWAPDRPAGPARRLFGTELHFRTGFSPLLRLECSPVQFTRVAPVNESETRFFLPFAIFKASCLDCSPCGKKNHSIHLSFNKLYVNWLWNKLNKYNTKILIETKNCIPQAEGALQA